MVFSMTAVMTAIIIENRRILTLGKGASPPFSVTFTESYLVLPGFTLRIAFRRIVPQVAAM